MTMQVIIYTDGACKGNPGVGGWGAVLQWGGKTRELCGGEMHTTNNRMELLAAISALLVLTRSCDVVLYTDSTYLKQGITTWLSQWLKNGGGTELIRLQGGRKKSVKNADLWMQLLAAVKPHKIDWRWVEAHVGHAGNELADALANQGVREVLERGKSSVESESQIVESKLQSKTESETQPFAESQS